MVEIMPKQYKGICVKIYSNSKHTKSDVNKRYAPSKHLPVQN